MLNGFRRLFLLLLLLVPLAANAQPQPEQKKALDEEAVKKLITTLESDTARGEFIGNLKLLLEQQGGKEEETIAPITQTLGVESFTGGLVAKYQDFLARNDLKGSTVGKIALSVGAALFALVLTFLTRRVITRFLGFVDRQFVKLDMPHLRLRLYGRTLRTIATVALVGLLFYGWFAIWTTAKHNPFEAEWFTTTLKVVFNIGFVIFVAAFLWESLNVILQIIFKKMSGDNSSRAQTIMPIIRNVLFIVFAVLFALVLLSELGINIVPLLAGAGIVGVAIGFGAQTMVKDFITGFTILMEDVVRVGDVAKVAGHEGVVERITLRKVQLRDVAGRVYTIPFGEITTIENATKDFSFYPMDIGISYANDTDAVCEVLRKVDAELRADPAFAADMMEPIEIMGVDRFADSAVIIKARLKTQPLQQWKIGREFNRRMKKAFEAAGIEIPYPQRVVTVKGDKAAAAGL